MVNKYTDTLNASLEETMETLSSQNYERYAAHQRGKLSLFFDQGRVFTARLALQGSRIRELEARVNGDQAHEAAMLADNLHAGIEATLKKQEEASELVAKMAGATQVAANSIANLSSEIAAVLAICEASLQGSDIHERAGDIDVKAREVVANAEQASLDSLSATTDLSESVIPALVGATGNIRNLGDKVAEMTGKLFARAKNDYMVGKDAMDRAMKSVSRSKEKYFSGKRYLADADDSIELIGEVANMDLRIEVDCGEVITVSCRRFHPPFENSTYGKGDTYPLSGAECEYRMVAISSKDVYSVAREELENLPDDRCNLPSEYDEKRVAWRMSVGGERYPEMVDYEGKPLEYGINYRSIIIVRLAGEYALKPFSVNPISLPSRRFKPRIYLLKADTPAIDFEAGGIYFSLENSKRYKEVADKMELRVMLMPVLRTSLEGDFNVEAAKQLSRIESAVLKEINQPIDETDIEYLNTLASSIEGERGESIKAELAELETAAQDRLKQMEEFDALTEQRKASESDEQTAEFDGAIQEIERGAVQGDEQIRRLKLNVIETFEQALALARRRKDEVSELVFDSRIASSLSSNSYTLLKVNSGKRSYEAKIDSMTTDVCGNLLQNGNYYRAVVLTSVPREAKEESEDRYRPVLSAFSAPVLYENGDDALAFKSKRLATDEALRLV